MLDTIIIFLNRNYSIHLEMPHFKKLSTLLRESLNRKNGTHLYLLRHAQSIGNHAGSIVGWTDSKLSVKGRQQANLLFRGLYQNINDFTSIHSSDLSRCLHTLQISSGFSGVKITKDWRLRELNFGDEEGLHYDSLPEERRKKISSLEYQPPNGETWPAARKRAIQYLLNLPEGHHLVSTHGGLICALTFHLGVKKVVPNCSIVCVELNKDTKELERIEFIWQFQGPRKETEKLNNKVEQKNK